MARPEDRKKAIELRLQGKSYLEIKSELGLSKSTLSGWLSSYPLSPDQIKKIKQNRSKWIENFRISMANKRDAKDKKVYEEQKSFWLPLSPRELFLAGIFLYWGEGTKVGNGQVVISNSNPKILQFALYWLSNCFSISKDKVTIRLHLYNDMDINAETQFWAECLRLQPNKFKPPYVKDSKRSGLTYKSFGHGTCNLIYCSTEIKRKIMKSIEAISNEYSMLV